MRRSLSLGLLLVSRQVHAPCTSGPTFGLDAGFCDFH